MNYHPDPRLGEPVEYLATTGIGDCLEIQPGGSALRGWQQRPQCDRVALHELADGVTGGLQQMVA